VGGLADYENYVWDDALSDGMRVSCSGGADVRSDIASDAGL
jgi:hypothetical protein